MVYQQHGRYFEKTPSTTSVTEDKEATGRTFPTKNAGSQMAEEQTQQQKERKMKRWRLIVRNLPFAVDDDALRSHFCQFGEIVECRVAEPKRLKKSFNPSKAKGSGFGFIQFTQFPSAHKALTTMNMQPLEGRTIALDWAVPKDTYLSATLQGKDRSRSDDLAKKETDVMAEDSLDDKEKVKQEVVDSDDSDDNDDNSSNAGSMSDGSDDGQKIGDDEMSDEGLSSAESDADSTVGAGKKRKRTKKQTALPADKAVEEGRTLFVRNLSFDTTDDEFRDFFTKFGSVNYAIICKYPGTEHSKGSGFVQFADKSEADKCLYESNVSDTAAALNLGGRQLNICVALPRTKVTEMEKLRKEKAPSDNRNLHLMRLGVVRPGSKEANGMSETDAQRREKLVAANRERVKNLHIFVSPTRLVVHNLSKSLDDDKLRKLCLDCVGDKTAKITECRIWRDRTQVVLPSNESSTKVAARKKKGKVLGKSLGYGFVQFGTHKHALACLEKLNNNPAIFTDVKRPIVEFSLENKVALNKKHRRVEQSKQSHQIATTTKTQQPTSRWTESDLVATKKKLSAGGQKPLPKRLGPKIRTKKGRKAEPSTNKDNAPDKERSRKRTRKDIRTDKAVNKQFQQQQSGKRKAKKRKYDATKFLAMT